MIKKGEVVVHINSGKKIKVPRLVRMHSDEMEEVSVAKAGEIVALFGVDCATGDSFTDGSIKCPPPPPPIPSMHLSCVTHSLYASLLRHPFPLCISLAGRRGLHHQVVDDIDARARRGHVARARSEEQGRPMPPPPPRHDGMHASGRRRCLRLTVEKWGARGALSLQRIQQYHRLPRGM